jgi:hypothetical protein
MKKILFALLLVFGVFLVQCSSSNNEKNEEQQDTIDTQVSKSEVKRSELAILMRDLYNNTRAYGKNGITQLKPFSKDAYEKYTQIKHATPTDPKNTGEVFQTYSDNFLNSLEKLTHPEEVNMANYNNMVDNCLACHSNHCPGPMLVIRKMKIIKEI